MTLTELDSKVLQELLYQKEVSSMDLCKKLNLPKTTLSSIIEKLFTNGMISIKEKKNQYEWFLTKKGHQTLTSGNLPEVAVLLKLKEKEKIPISDLNDEEKKIGIAFGIKNNWFKLSSGVVFLTEDGKKALLNKTYLYLPPEEKLNSLDEPFLNFLAKRGLIEKKVSTSTLIISITKEGEKYLKEKTQTLFEIKELDRQMLLSGSWKKGKIIEYNLNLEVQPNQIARHHPIELLKRKIQSIFIGLGFKQMDGPLVESSLWNFDALFQPQDHPARDLADTFYLNKKSKLPETDLVKKIKNIHEKKWGGEWSKDFASTTVLRTHTTSLSARTLYNKTSKEPEKFFAIGKVFRNEATDYKHLAEFYQIEGIVVWEKATFCHLLGLLKEFYSKLGFEKIRFRPSYFPYTEPSLEIEIFDKTRNSWLELGGAGIFRPEVCHPLCNIYPVLAWGLSLERPLMITEKISDIRSIYKNELDWLREFRYIK